MAYSQSYDAEMKMIKVEANGKYMKIFPLEGMSLRYIAYHFIKQHDLDDEDKERIKSIKDVIPLDTSMLPAEFPKKLTVIAYAKTDLPRYTFR